MKKLFKQSIRHWLMLIPIFFLTFDEKINLTLLGTILISLFVAVAIEIYQYITETKIKNKIPSKEYYIASVVDILVTVLAGVLGYYLAKFLM